MLQWKLDTEEQAEEGIAMVNRYDANTPSSLKPYLEFMGLTEEEFRLIDDLIQIFHKWLMF